MTISQLPSNVLYGQINRRFDRRASLLRRLGFTYVSDKGLASFVRTKRGRTQSIAASAVLGYHNRLWREIILAGYCR